MPLHTEECTIADIPGIVDCIRDAYSSPYHPFVDLVHPGMLQNSIEGIAAAESHYIKGLTTNPNERWLKVIDTDEDMIVGVSRWVIFQECPFANGVPNVEALWYPEGSRIREYTTFVMNDRIQRQATRCTQPNVWLGTMGVRPSYRRRGIATMMVQWGVDIADELDIDTFVEASWHGSQVYQRLGLQYIDEFKPKRPKETEGDKWWDQLEKEYPFEGLWFWRPKKTATKGADV